MTHNNVEDWIKNLSDIALVDDIKGIMEDDKDQRSFGSQEYWDISDDLKEQIEYLVEVVLEDREKAQRHQDFLPGPFREIFEKILYEIG